MAAASSSVVRRVEELGDLAQAHIQQLSEAAGEDDHFLIRASAALEKLKLQCGEDKECSTPSNLLELYTQAILDMTYFEENKLVDEDFPEDSSQKVKELINFLSEPEILVKENNMHPKHCDLLGDELLECLSWRRGALLYMYCHSLTKRRDWLTRKSSLLKKYLVDGISYLLQMLNFRCPIQLNEGASFQDLDTAKLLSEGIFSDIHLLAMMYSGEMCYWGLKHCADQQPENHEMDIGVSGASYATHKEPLDFREVGEKILKNITLTKYAWFIKQIMKIKPLVSVTNDIFIFPTFYFLIFVDFSVLLLSYLFCFFRASCYYYFFPHHQPLSEFSSFPVQPWFSGTSHEELSTHMALSLVLTENRDYAEGSFSGSHKDIPSAQSTGFRSSLASLSCIIFFLTHKSMHYVFVLLSLTGFCFPTSSENFQVKCFGAYKIKKK
ncbi:hypothetical protein E5288_WYG000449 [Bos mutus]|uniref:CE051 protein n=1 Tax=Bos mutus TaxID=72004 RepID=A0A6B0QPY3_9CETA|nr:hypothetical protein [Bos mutus]